MRACLQRNADVCDKSPEDSSVFQEMVLKRAQCDGGGGGGGVQPGRVKGNRGAGRAVFCGRLPGYGEENPRKSAPRSAWDKSYHGRGNNASGPNAFYQHKAAATPARVFCKNF
jgi:hypothetical protein